MYELVGRLSVLKESFGFMDIGIWTMPCRLAEPFHSFLSGFYSYFLLFSCSCPLSWLAVHPLQPVCDLQMFSVLLSIPSLISCPSPFTPFSHLFPFFFPSRPYSPLRIILLLVPLQLGSFPSLSPFLSFLFPPRPFFPHSCFL